MGKGEYRRLAPVRKARSALPRKFLQQRQILHQTIKLGLPGFRIRDAQNRRRMSGNQTDLTEGLDGRKFPANICDSDRYAKNAGGGGSTEPNHNLWLNQLDLRLEPGMAGLNFSRSRFLVQSALAKRLPFKVFDRIGDITEITIDLCLVQRAI